jgi:hypothetical protein
MQYVLLLSHINCLHAAPAELPAWASNKRHTDHQEGASLRKFSCPAPVQQPAHQEWGHPCSGINSSAWVVSLSLRSLRRANQPDFLAADLPKWIRAALITPFSSGARKRTKDTDNFRLPEVKVR